MAPCNQSAGARLLTKFCILHQSRLLQRTLDVCSAQKRDTFVLNVHNYYEKMHAQKT